MRYDLHVHFKYSYDSFTSPEKIIKVAKKRRLDGVAITDHGAIKGEIEAFKMNSDKDFYVVVGTAIKTEYGDVVGLFLNEEIRSRKFEDVIEEMKSQDGLSVLAQPYRQYKFPEELMESVDRVEGFNARSRIEDNEGAYELAMRVKKSMTAGSDVHLSFEMGGRITIMNSEIEEALKEGGAMIWGKNPLIIWLMG